MEQPTETQTQSPDAPPTESTPRRPSFITPEMIERQPILAVAGIFAGDSYFDLLVQEIKKERARARRRERREMTK